MKPVRDFARPEILSLRPYSAAAFFQDAVRLNANEAPWRSGVDHSDRGLNRYPSHRPENLRKLLAEHYGVDAERLFVTRGSSEAIDLLIRCFCRPYRDSVVVCPPTFGMYEVYAGIQAAGVRRVPLDEQSGFEPDTHRLLAEWSDADKLLFLTSPNNPTGNCFALDRIDRLCESLAGRGIVVVDAAYAEFSDKPDPTTRYEAMPHVVVLRTMSKAYGMAGARCGAAIANPDVTELLARVMPPYAVPTPSSEAATAALAADGFRELPRRIDWLKRERKRVADVLEHCAVVDRVYPSDANFLYVRFRDAAQVMSASRAAGLLLRDLSGEPGQRNCLRITIGATEHNNRLLACIAELEPTV